MLNALEKKDKAFFVLVIIISLILISFFSWSTYRYESYQNLKENHCSIYFDCTNTLGDAKCILEYRDSSVTLTKFSSVCIKDWSTEEND